MLKVKVECIPFGSLRRKRIIGSMEIINDTTAKDRPRTGNYKYTVWDARSEVVKSGVIKEFNRRKGFWSLINLVTKSLKNENRYYVKKRQKLS